MTSAPAPRLALVTGAGTRVGREIALALGRDGVRVAVHFHRNEEGARATCDELAALGPGGMPISGDLTRAGAAHALVDEAITALGGLDLLVGNAANFDRVAFDELDGGAWQRALDLNLTANFALAHRAAAELRARRGNMVFITCASTTTPMRNYLPYVVSKAGLRQLVRTLALELAPEVRVNAVAPGTVLPPEDFPPATLTRLVQQTPLGRAGTARDVADAVVYLAKSAFVTGQELVVDGGRTVAGFERPSEP